MMRLRHPTRWIRVTWLADLAEHAPRNLTSQAARAALEAVDAEDTDRLLACLRSMTLHAATWPVRDLAAGAVRCVENAVREMAGDAS
jgi:hypothetical protein